MKPHPINFRRELRVAIEISDHRTNIVAVNPIGAEFAQGLGITAVGPIAIIRLVRQSIDCTRAFNALTAADGQRERRGSWLHGIA
nr:hypothetical protein [Rhizobium leguminosarum]